MENIDALTSIVADLTRLAAKEQSAGLKTEGFAELSMRQIYYLDTISKLPDPTPTELAGIMKVTKPSVSAAVDRLEKMGLICKTVSVEDRRSYSLHLTGKGERVASFHNQLHRQMAERLVQALTPQECEQFLALMKKIASHINDEG